MNIALINASPKAKGSASGEVLNELASYLAGHVLTEVAVHAGSRVERSRMEEITRQDALVFAFPLYVDGIPAHLLRFLVELEPIAKGAAAAPMVYAVANCGFFEGRQNRNTLTMMKLWCEKAGARWGQGVGIGGGGMLVGLQNVPYGRGPRKNPSHALSTLAVNVAAGKGGADLLIDSNFPRFLYKAAAEMGWRAQIKQNGRSTKDLFIQK